MPQVAQLQEMFRKHSRKRAFGVTSAISRFPVALRRRLRRFATGTKKGVARSSPPHHFQSMEVRLFILEVDSVSSI